MLIKLDDAVPLRIPDTIGEHGGTALPGSGVPENLLKALSIKNVVPENQAHGVVADEIAADQEGLRQARGFSLHGIAEVNAEPGAVAQQVFKLRRVPRRRNQ